MLIAFVIVAATFSYGMLGVGFTTTQKSEDVVHSGISQVSSSLVTSGDVIVQSKTAGSASNVIFYLTNSAGGTPVDLNKTLITYSDYDIIKSREYGTGTNGWDYNAIICDTGHDDNLLEPGEKYKINIDLDTFEVSPLPVENEQVRIEIKPPQGAVLTIQFTTPSVLEANKYYSVF